MKQMSYLFVEHRCFNFQDEWSEYNRLLHLSSAKSSPNIITIDQHTT